VCVNNLPKVDTQWNSGATRDSNPGYRARVPCPLTTRPLSQTRTVRHFDERTYGDNALMNISAPRNSRNLIYCFAGQASMNCRVTPVYQVTSYLCITWYDVVSWYTGVTRQFMEACPAKHVSKVRMCTRPLKPRPRRDISRSRDGIDAETPRPRPHPWGVSVQSIRYRQAVLILFLYSSKFAIIHCQSKNRANILLPISLRDINRFWSGLFFFDSQCRYVCNFFYRSLMLCCI